MATSEQRRNDAIELHQESAKKRGLTLRAHKQYYIELYESDSKYPLDDAIHWSDINGFLIGWDYK